MDREQGAGPNSQEHLAALPPAYYAAHADELGWGPGQQRMSSVRLDALLSHSMGTGTTSLDLGCGSGMYVNELGRRGFRMVGIDFTMPFLTQAAAGGEAGRFVCGDVLRLPFASKSFDSVSMLTVLEHIPDDLGALREAVRVARSRLIVMVPLREDEVLLRSGLCLKNRLDRSHLHYYSGQEIKELMEGAGCKVVEQYSVNIVALRYLVSQCLRLPAAAVFLVRAFLKLLPWRDYYNECITVADLP